MLMLLFQAVKQFMVNYKPMVFQEKAFPMLMVLLVSQYKKYMRYGFHGYINSVVRLDLFSLS